MSTLPVPLTHLAQTPLSQQLKDPDLLRAGGFINGQWQLAGTGPALHVLDPATGDRLASVGATDAAGVRQALQAAHQAQPAWAALPAKERSAHLMAWHALILAHVDDL